VATEPLSAFLERTRVRVDEALERYLRRAPACPDLVCDAMRYSLFAGGKRLRPILTIASAEAIDPGAGNLAMPAACALAREPAGDDPALGARKLRVLRTIGDAAGPMGMVGGQTIDLQAAGQAPGHAIALDAEGVRGMHARKTGALIRASAASGAVMAGADDRTIAAVDVYAAEIGLAFQIVDDILDVEGDPAALGKTTGKDAAGAKPTYPALFGLEQSRQLAADCLARAHAALADARLGHSRLGAIAEWVVTRKS
jgi:geranylgeranyl pyrophosphate synthase